MISCQMEKQHLYAHKRKQQVCIKTSAKQKDSSMCKLHLPVQNNYLEPTIVHVHITFLFSKMCTCVNT